MTFCSGRLEPAFLDALPSIGVAVEALYSHIAFPGFSEDCNPWCAKSRGLGSVLFDGCEFDLIRMFIRATFAFLHQPVECYLALLIP